MRRSFPCAILISFALLEGTALCPTSSPARPQLNDLGHHRFRITTASAECQRAFDRGLNLAYSFGHLAAEQEFRRALKADPNCAMAYWGIALVNGPHINFPFVPPDKAAVAWEALTQARRLAEGRSRLERALIEALGARYANPQPEDRSALDRAYGSAMKSVWKAFPNSAEAATLYAEACMDLHPWDFWANGLPQPWTAEILEALRDALRLDPMHPGANHFYVHMLEASPHPEEALSAADRLRSLVPDSSHMVHMPSHIYSRVGRWEDAAKANRKAMTVDNLYRAAYPHPGLYAMYMAHNAHFLTWVSMMQGRRAVALESARQMVAQVPDEFLKEFADVADGYMAIVPETMMRFGLWEDILKEPEPRSDLPLARALWHYTRAAALTALNRKDEARTEREAFARAASAVPQDRVLGNNSAAALLAIATLVLEGERSAKEQDFARSVLKLQEAVRLEDKLRYDEPPDWIQPTRHTLGAVLLRAGRAAEAQNVYSEDLQRNPENGWALMGLRDALSAQGRTAEAAKVSRRLHKAWANADVSPKWTCYCQEGN